VHARVPEPSQQAGHDHAEAGRVTGLSTIDSGPPPPAGSFDAAAAKRGESAFNVQGPCATCHVPPLFTEPGWNNHKPSEIDDFQANRTPDRSYRTAPLKGLWTYDTANGPGATGPGYYHDGRFKDSNEVVAHCDAFLKLSLTPEQKGDLIQYQYLKSQ
jgi:hypothetical protein